MRLRNRPGAGVRAATGPGTGAASVDRLRAARAAIGQALARWDLGPLLDKLIEPMNRAKAHVSVGDVFRYIFDFGDDWTCRCMIVSLGDSEQLYGIVPDTPAVIWGWGSPPDQYGRSRPDDGAADDEQLDAAQQAQEEQEVHHFITDFGRGQPAFVDPGRPRRMRSATRAPCWTS